MSNITYVAKRNIATGHSVSTEYSIDFNAEAFPLALESDSVTHYSLNNTPKTVFKSIRESYQVTTDIIDFSSTTMEYWKEFISSVMGGETFTFDRTGTAASPVNAVSCTLESKSVRQSFLGGKYLRLTFNVLLLP